MVRLKMKLGSKDGLGTYDLIQFLSKAARIEEGMIGHIEIGADSTRVEIHKQRVEQTLRALDRAKYRGKRVEANVDAQ